MKWMLNPDRYFSPQKDQRKLARDLYEQIKDLPIVSPHGHVNPRLFSTSDATFGSPAELLIIPDHYVVRMLYSQGIPLESLGIPDYDQIQEKLQSDDFKPRNLLTKLNIEVLCTTDAASDSLEELKEIRKEKFGQKIYPTFRPDAVTNLAAEGWLENIEALSAASGIEVVDYHSYIHALEQRRAFFKTMGAHATDHGVYSAARQELSLSKAEEIFHRALKNEATPEDAACFTSHMLMEMARMSSEDGLVMQIHVGSYRNHNNAVFQKFGPDNGFDIPVTAEFTKAFRPLLNKFGNASNLNLILFCLDEDVYSRELAPLAGVYPSVKLGPPWWFYDSPNGMKRYFDRVMETAGIYNTAGFNDDTRAFLSIPARHDVWRRVSSNWLAELMLTSRIDEEDALDMAYQLAYGLVKKAYRFE